MRTCPVCKQAKPLNEWYKGTRGYCKACMKVYAHKRYLNGLQPSIYRRNTVRRQIYGLNEFQINEIMLDQDDKCAICGKELDWASMHVDHDHSNRNVRGLLCNRCNTGLGFFRDDPEIIRSAIAYLKKHSA